MSHAFKAVVTAGSCLLAVAFAIYLAVFGMSALHLLEKEQKSSFSVVVSLPKAPTESSTAVATAISEKIATQLNEFVRSGFDRTLTTFSAMLGLLSFFLRYHQEVWK